ncbi:MAG: methionine biosynthesis protein MetW [Planctomycetota bacterium]
MKDKAAAAEIAHITAFLAERFAEQGVSVESLRQAVLVANDQTEAIPYRWQDELIMQFVPPNARVLDLGCGSGELLERLVRERGVTPQGVEIDAMEVVACIERGVPVLQADIDEGLKQFPDATFDVVVLEETLQTLRRPDRLLEEMLRVGRHGVVTFPNFAHWRVRLDLVLHGHMPVTRQLPHSWYDTPNIHLCSINDFLVWVHEAGAAIEAGHVLVEGAVRPYAPGDNLHASEALFIVSR